MHVPKKFQQNDPSHLKGIIQQYPFGTLITHSDTGLEANHIPFILNQSDGKDVLQAHLAKVNPLWQNVQDNSDVLVVFHGPNCYVSPNYYPTKKETSKAVPTWNYIAVHVKGVMSFKHDAEWNLEMIDQLTMQHEQGQTIPWSTTDAPEPYIQKMLSAIVGIEIEISSIQGQWKLSQNQPVRNQEGVVSGLSEVNQGDTQKIAELVKQYALDY